MKNFDNIKKAPLEIATILANDTKIKQLLYSDDSDPLSADVSGITLNIMLEEHYISMVPPTENRIQEYGRNTFLSILVDTISPNAADNNVRANLIIYISTNADHLMIKDNGNRLLELANRVYLLLQGKKLSCAGEININSFSHVMLSEFHSGYRIALSIADQSTRKEDI